jgi:hypothetical protein
MPHLRMIIRTIMHVNQSATVLRGAYAVPLIGGLWGYSRRGPGLWGRRPFSPRATSVRIRPFPGLKRPPRPSTDPILPVSARGANASVDSAPTVREPPPDVRVSEPTPREPA